MINHRKAFTILVVDDNPGLITLIRKYLHREGFTTIVVSSGTEAMQWLSNHHADLMLLDLQLSDINGVDLVQSLDRQHQLPPFIVVTGHGDERLAVKMMKYGARDYVIKDDMLLELLPSIVIHTYEQLQGEQRLHAAEEELNAERERLSITLASIAEGVITTDTTGQITSMNAVAETLTGWKQQEAIGNFVDEVIYLVQQHELTSREDPVKGVLDSGETFNPIQHRLLFSREGTERAVVTSAAPIRRQDKMIIGAVLVIRDMTDRIRVDQELLKASKLESLGILAGGIAHDFNNLLTGILGNISLSKISLNPKTETYNYLAEAEKASLRAKSLTQQLLTFAQGGAPLKKPMTLEPMITESATFALRGTKSQCRFHFRSDLWGVEADKGQLSHVIHNLVINAHQAMPRGGTITLSGENISIHTNEVDCKVALPIGRYVKISITDEGIGIPAEYLTQIFDPYFTTKQSGSGLGLSTAYSVTKNHGGTMTVSSELGKGTQLSLYLPASSSPITIHDENLPASINGEGKILVMDDEDSVRILLEEMLSHLGYEVESVPDGDNAVTRYKQAQAMHRGYSAVILDLTIPGGLGGKDTLQQLRKIDPNVRAIVASGYSNDPLLSQYTAFGFLGMVAKPFQLGELSEVLHRVTV
ncbi:MAG: response regulator [Nitrospirales bacterium]